MSENQDMIVSEPQQVSAEVIYQQDKAAIDIQIATAKQYPRNVLRATNNALATATMDKETAETCTYSVPRGGKPITGPSVHLAKIIAQQWGNMRIEAKVIGADATHVTSEAICFDLESNLAIKVQVKRSIVGKYGRYNDDMITVTGNATNSIAMRNAIFAIVPKAVVNKVYRGALQTITGDVSDETKLTARRKQVIDALMGTYGVSEKEVLSAVGKASVQHITGDDLAVLIGIGTAIKDGDTTVEEAFNPKTAKATKEEKEADRIDQVIADCKTVEEVQLVEGNLPPEIRSDDRIKKLLKDRKMAILNGPAGSDADGGAKSGKKK